MSPQKITSKNSQEKGVVFIATAPGEFSKVKKLAKYEQQSRGYATVAAQNILLKAFEQSAIEKMTYSDVKNEKHAVAKNITANTIGSIGSIAVGTLVGSPFAVISTPSPRAVKTQKRISSDDAAWVSKTSADLANQITNITKNAIDEDKKNGRL